MALQDLKDQASAIVQSAFDLGASSGDKLYSQAELDAAVAQAKQQTKDAVKALVDAEAVDLKGKIDTA